jgi:16S rRNA G1207 methylase RsmC
MVLPENGCVLDVGCGYGAVGIAAAVFNPSLQVVMTDVNARAVWLARQNVEKNNAKNAEARRGRFYEPVNDLVFDCVLSNPPVSAGMKTVKTIILDAPEHMTQGGLFQMVLRSKVSGKRLCTVFEETFGNVKILARESGYRVLVSVKH